MSGINNDDGAAEFERRLAAMDDSTKELVVKYVAALVPKEVEAERVRCMGILALRANLMREKGRLDTELVIRSLIAEIRGAM